MEYEGIYKWKDYGEIYCIFMLIIKCKRGIRERSGCGGKY